MSEANNIPVTEITVPSRKIGFTTMTIIIAFVAYWMSQQGSITTYSEIRSSDTEELEGFSSEAWYLPDDNLFGFVEIPTGEFTMGSDPALDRLAYENERWSSVSRQGTVFLSTFYINRFETTKAQFQQFVDDNGLNVARDILEGDQIEPVSNITWPEAVAYAQWLDSKLRDSGFTPEPLRKLLENGGSVVLPTEAEWEKAARTSDARTFPWGGRPTSEFANFNASAKRGVGAESCTACANGLSDMAGNVWEMTRSPLQDYPYDPDDDAENLRENALWVMRGGSYADDINNIRTAVRGAVDPGVRNDTIGFRVAISPH
ncbi:MAG: hypothetical protein CMQ28_04285 [Gammaproteobacteria bacterium]|nr:hypothetical protein [Gammaproteobacteria bacterium]